MEKSAKGTCRYKHFDPPKDGCVCTINLDDFVVQTDENGDAGDNWDAVIDGTMDIPDYAFELCYEIMYYRGSKRCYDTRTATLTNTEEVGEELYEYLLDEVDGTLPPNSTLETHITIDVCYYMQECSDGYALDPYCNIWEEPVADLWFDIHFTAVEE